jgi:hypothetical protein
MLKEVQTICVISETAMLQYNFPSVQRSLFLGQKVDWTDYNEISTSLNYCTYLSLVDPTPCKSLGR